MGGPRYIIFVIYGWAHHHIILLSTIHYGWAQIYYICYLRVGPSPYNIIMSRTLRVGPDILNLLSTGWAHHHIILLSTVHYGWAQTYYPRRWAQIYYICDLQVGPPPYNIIINRTLRVGPDILYPSSAGGPTCI
jgi:hypothetical protein